MNKILKFLTFLFFEIAFAMVLEEKEIINAVQYTRGLLGLMTSGLFIQIEVFRRKTNNFLFNYKFIIN